jgi:hypothetical protein
MAMANRHAKLETVGQRNLKILGGQDFLSQAPVTLTFGLVTSKSIGIIY